jgi:hypothetical protein
MKTIHLLKTKAGKGLKIVVDGTWYYTSIIEFTKMANDKQKAVVFRTIEN